MQAKLSLIFLIAIAFTGCALDMPGTPPPGESAQPNFLAEPAYDAWAAYDAQGAVIEEGRNELPAKRPHGLASRALAMSSGAPALHPGLSALLDQAPDGELLDVVIAARTGHRLSALPRYRRDLDPDAAANLEIERERQLIRQADGELRALDRRPLVTAIESLGGKVSAEYRVGNAVVATLSAGALRQLLAERNEIAAASPVHSGEAPAAWRYVSSGRTEQVSDQLVSAGYDAGGYRIGLLDTGVYASHTVFTNPDPILFWRDCSWTYDPNCNMVPTYPWYLYYNASDPVAAGGHGTEMADIIAGNSDMGNYYRGVAPGAYLDSVNVFSPTDHTALDQSAVLRAFDFLDGYDDVIVADVAADEYAGGAIALAADDLYDEGLIVIAPAGNIPSYLARSPAVAHKVLGIGGTGYAGSYGESDGRFKPDITAPTGVYAAANTGSQSAAWRDGTCPAAAFAGGAAALLRDYYDYRGWSADPGAIYAAMITFGNLGGDDIDACAGAGALELGEVANSYWTSGVRYLDPDDSYDIYFYVGSGACDLRAGIWWAEDQAWPHSTEFLYLYRGSTWLKSSIHSDSVFQKVVYPGSLGGGWWKITIASYIYNTRQDIKVHYLVHYRTGC